MNPQWLPADDYLGYWASTNITLHGNNPYTPNWIQILQSETGVSNDLLIVLNGSQWLLPTWSPPWTFPLVMPFGLLDYEISRVAWFLVNILFTFLCAEIIWRLYGGQEKYRWASWLVAFTFIPVLDAIKKGQIGIIILLGIVGFLYFHDKKRPWLAGISLVLLTIKPHVAYLFLLAVIIWSIYGRKWSVIFGFTIVLIGTTIISSIFNTSIIPQYLYALKNYPPSDWITPTIGGSLRLLFGSGYFWLQFLPSVFGIVWLIIYWFKHRNNWDWFTTAPLVVLVSLLTTAYGWSFDQPASLVAIIQIFVLISLLPWRSASWLILISYILINVINLLSPGNEIYLFWLAPAMLVWFIISRWLIEYRVQRAKSTISS